MSASSDGNGRDVTIAGRATLVARVVGFEGQVQYWSEPR